MVATRPAQCFPVSRGTLTSPTCESSLFRLWASARGHTWGLLRARLRPTAGSARACPFLPLRLIAGRLGSSASPSGWLSATGQTARATETAKISRQTKQLVPCRAPARAEHRTGLAAEAPGPPWHPTVWENPVYQGRHSATAAPSQVLVPCSVLSGCTRSCSLPMTTARWAQALGRAAGGLGGCRVGRELGELTPPSPCPSSVLPQGCGRLTSTDHNPGRTVPDRHACGLHGAGLASRWPSATHVLGQS